MPRGGGRGGGRGFHMGSCGSRSGSGWFGDSSRMDGLKREGDFIPAKIVLGTVIPGFTLRAMQYKITAEKYPRLNASGYVLTTIGMISLMWNLLQAIQD